MVFLAVFVSSFVFFSLLLCVCRCVGWFCGSLFLGCLLVFLVVCCVFVFAHFSVHSLLVVFLCFWSLVVLGIFLLGFVVACGLLWVVELYACALLALRGWCEKVCFVFGLC